MQTYTQDFNDAIRAADREMRGYLEFNGDNTKQMHGADGLIQFTVHREMQNAERFCVGSVASSYCEASFFNSGIPAGVSLANSYFDAYVGVVLPDTTVEYKPLGRFFIAEISRETETTAVVGYDEIAYKMDVPYTPTITAGVNGYKALDILNDIIDQTGCNGGTHYSGWNWYVPQLVEASCKDTFAWIVAAGRSYASDLITAYDYSGTPTVASKRFNKTTYTSYPAITDDVIYMDGLKLGDTFTISSYTTGTEDNPIVCGSGVGPNNPNPYINSTQANTIFADINGETYTPMTLHFRGDPCIMVNDCLKVTTGGVDYKCVPMRMVSTFNGGFEQTIDCWGDSEAYYEMSYSPMEAKIKTNSTMLQEMAQAIETARNGVITQILDTDGSWKELCISNNQDLMQATSVWRFNINGLAHSTAYQGGTYTFALDDQGRIVASVIQTGILQDALGHNSWNLDTGAFTITDGTINITTSTATFDQIVLVSPVTPAYSYRTYMRSGGFEVVDLLKPYGTSTNRRVTIGTAGLQGSDINLGGGSYTKGYILSDGMLSLESLTSSNHYEIMLRTEANAVFPSGLYVSTPSGVGEYSYGSVKLSQSGVPRTLLSDSGLTFYNSSGTVTAEYPSGGTAVTASTVISSSVPNATVTATRSIALTPGKYIIFAYVYWPNNSTGRRQMSISGSDTNINAGIAHDYRNAVSGDVTRQTLTVYYQATANTTFYLDAYQNSGSALSLSAYGMQAIELP